MTQRESSIADQKKAAGDSIVSDAHRDQKRLLAELRRAEDEELVEAEQEVQSPDPQRSAQLLRSVRQRLECAAGVTTRLSAVQPQESTLDGATRPGVPRPRPPQPLRRYLWIAIPVALAAVLLIAPWLFPSKPMPRYALEIQGDARHLGSPAAGPEPIRVALDSYLDIVLRPRTSVEGKVVVRSYARQAEQLYPLAAPLHRFDEGTVSLHSTPRSLAPLGPGQWELVFVLARPGKLPAQPELEAALASTAEASAADPPSNWLLLRRTIDVVAR